MQSKWQESQKNFNYYWSIRKSNYNCGMNEKINNTEAWIMSLSCNELLSLMKNKIKKKASPHISCVRWKFHCKSMEKSAHTKTKQTKTTAVNACFIGIRLLNYIKTMNLKKAKQLLLQNINPKQKRSAAKVSRHRERETAVSEWECIRTYRIHNLWQ